MKSTDIMAIYGAIIATAALGWQIISWCKERPRLRIDIKTDMVLSADGISYAKEKNSGVEKKVLFIHITNLGNLPTTLLYIRIKTKNAGWVNISYTNPDFPLPMCLEPGKIWRTQKKYTELTQEVLDSAKDHPLFVEVSHSFSDKPAQKTFEISTI